MYICASSTAPYKWLCLHYCDDDRQATRQTIASALLDPPFLPFSFASLFLVSNGNISTDLLWVPSVNILHPTQLLTNGMDAKPVCPFCLKTDGAPPSLTHACASCNAPMYGVVSVVATSKSEEAAVALEYLLPFYGWKPIADHWECSTTINSGSTVNAVHFLQHKVERHSRQPMVYEYISL